MAAGQRGIARQRQHPVRVRPVQIGIRVNHPAHPDTEFHTQRLHVIDNRRQAVGVFFSSRYQSPSAAQSSLRP